MVGGDSRGVLTLSRVTISCKHALCVSGTHAMRSGLTSALVPSPALSKAVTKGELLGGQRQEAGGPGLHTYPWSPQMCFFRGFYPTRPSQNQAVFQASPPFCPPQNQHNLMTLPSMESTMGALFLLRTVFTLSVNLHYLSVSCEQQPWHLLLLPFYLPGGATWASHLSLCCV